ncbi:MAG: 2-oxoacid:acceptor oxidoreductase family protein [Candidatus Omnitrophica bacterium]|nr:2-oxoacid:acceptor oxidoreductase family protein [Candidatus Omnitrophota bacterium]MCM8793996.1 2-oxoacid:acceptor oxidoreductase family protein [Candidatus Omnitrophota bacterium]
MKEEVICAGFGGQGIMVLGKILALAAMKEDKFVTWMPSYGAEVRGGTAHSMVVISDREITSPVITNPTTAIVMNQPSLDKFLPKTKAQGLVIVNTSLAKVNPTRKDLEILKVPATEMAAKLGNIKVANMIILGAYLAKRKTLSLESVLNALPETISAEFLELNEIALRTGFNL